MAKKTESRAADEDVVEQILEECTKAVKKGLGQKRAGREATEFWTTRTRERIEEQVKKGTNWDKARTRVLPTAVKMGKVAAALTGEFEVVPLWAAKAATEAVKDDPKCQKDPGGAGVLGGFCP